MALPHVTALIHQAIAEHYDGISVAALERRLRKRKNSIQQWCDTQATITLPPVADTIYALADALQVKSGDLWLAFWRDAAEYTDSPLYEVAKTPQAREGLTSQELAVLERYNQTDPSKRHLIFAVMDVFLPGNHPPSPSARLLHGNMTEADAHAVAQSMNNGETIPSPVPDQTQRVTTHHPDAVAS